jgi:hypothetical protein
MAKEIKRIFARTSGGEDWQGLLAKPVLHWKEGASAMTAAAAWEDAADCLPPEVGTLLTASTVPEMIDLALLAAIPEWQVALPGGTTHSATDILALCRNDLGLCVLAVEAKVLEDFGPRLEEKRRSPTPGQLERLEYLHALLKVPHFEDDIRYQLLHRTASALLTAQQFHAKTAVMLVHAFATPADRMICFQAFCAAMGAEQVAPGIWRVPRFTTPTLYLAWCAGNEEHRNTALPTALRFRAAY